MPLRGAYPTSAWAVGHAFADPRSIHIPGNTAPGTYRLVIGLYRMADGSRLPIEAGDDSLVLETLILVQ